MSQKKDSAKLQFFSTGIPEANTILKKLSCFLSDQMVESFLSINTRQAIMTVQGGIACFKSGVVTKKQLRRQARIMKDLLNTDSKSLNREIRDLIAAL